MDSRCWRRASCVENLVFVAALALSAPGFGQTDGKEPPPLGPNGREAKILSNIRRLTTAGEKSGEAYFSPTDDLVIYQSVRGDWPFYQMYVIKPDGGGDAMISTGQGRTTCGFFDPLSDRVLWASSHEGPDLKDEAERRKKPFEGGRSQRYAWDFDEHMELYTSKRDGSDLQRLTDQKGYDAEASYSHDGKRLVFTSNRLGDLDLFVMDRDGKNLQQLTTRPGYDGGPFFSPDDREIVYRGDPYGNDHLQVFIVAADGSQERQVTHLPDAVNWAPFWHPSGKFLAFATSHYGGHGNYEIALIRPDGTGMVRLTETPKFDGLPTFNADGTTIMWTSERVAGRSQVFLAEFDVQAALSALDQAARQELRRGFPPPSSGADRTGASEKISADEIQAHVDFLADDARRGRGTGDIGAEEAAAYVAARFAELGLKPGGYGGAYYQFFEVDAGMTPGKHNELSLVTKHGERHFKRELDFAPLAFSGVGEVEGEVVFCGYGISAPRHGYDDYATVDVKGKIALLLRYHPGDADGKDPFGGEASLLSDLRFKLSNAKQHGAQAVIFATGPRQSDAPARLGELPGSGMRGAASDLPAIFVSTDAASALCRAARFDLADLQKTIDESGREASVALDGVTVRLRTDLTPKKAGAVNVLGYLEGSDPSLKHEVVVVGGHYDHLGLGEQGGSLGKGSAATHNGADDNASGTAAVIEIAEKFTLSSKHPKRSVLFAAWGAEEMGLLGSDHYVKHPLFPIENTVLCVNLDMVGRMKDNKLVVGGAESAEQLDVYLREFNRNYRFELSLGGGLAGGSSDHASFQRAGVPVLFFFTNIHEDYHKPSDDADKINAPDAAKIADMAHEVAAYFADEPTRLIAKEPAADPHAGMANLPQGDGSQPYVGSIPDYAGEGPGVKLSGVTPGGPAEKAGLRAGDVVVEFDGAPINDIYDYTAAIRARKPGDTIAVTVLREGTRVTVDLTLGRR